MPNSRFSAIAAPTNSARSVAIAISSACTHRPQRDRPREVLAAQLRQVAPGRDADLRRQVLDQHRHQVRARAAPTAAGSRTSRRRRCWWRSCPGRRRRCRPRTPGRAAAARRAQAAARARMLASAAAARGRATAAPSRRRRRRRAHASTSTRIARASAPPSTWTSSPKRGEERAAERLLLDDLEAVARARCRARQVAQHLRVGVRDAHEAPAAPASSASSATGRPSSISRSRGRDRVAVRVVRRVAELRGDQLLELLGEHVLEHLGLVVHAVPRHAERLGQVELEQAVVADDLERDARARRRSARRRGRARA